MRKPIIASYILLVVFILLTVFTGNAEFMIYAATLIPFVILIHWSDKYFKYHEIALWGFALWMLMHLLGGQAYIGGIRLYDYMLLDIVGEPYLVLKYDQFVHFYCYVVMAGLLGSVIQKITKPKAHRFTVGVILVLAASGIGAINEIIEFLPVVFFDSPGPGGYINTAIDIIMNFLGSVAGAWLFFRK